MPHLQGFPGNPVIQNANTNGAPCVATLPAPAAGSRQYLAGFIVTIDPVAAALTTTALFSGLDSGSGSGPAFNFTTGPGLPVFSSVLFPRPWPSSAQATSIAMTLSSIAANMRITLFGYNVPE